GVSARKADGQFLLVRQLPIHNEVSARHCDFNRPVKVDKHRPPNMPPPIIEMFGGKHLPDEKNLLDALQVHLREQIKIGDVHHDRGDPENEVDRILDEKIHQLDWKGGGLVRDNHPGCPFRNAQAKLERVRVKINWRQA